MQYHYNKREKDFPLIKKGTRVHLSYFTSDIGTDYFCFNQWLD